MSGALTDAHHDWVADTFGIDPRSYASSPPASPDPAPPEDSGGLLGAVSHAAAAVGDAVRGAATGVCDAAASLASQAGDAVAGTGVVGAAVVDSVKMDVDFGKGVVEGVAAGVTGLVTGGAESAVAVAKEFYALATAEQARADAAKKVASAAEAVGDCAAPAVTDPGRALGAVGDAVASGAEGVARVAKQVYGSYEAAAAAGHGAEFLGKAVGQGAVLAGGALIPGVGEAEAGVVAAEGAVAVGEGSAALTEGAAVLGEGAAASIENAAVARESVAAFDMAEAGGKVAAPPESLPLAEPPPPPPPPPPWPEPPDDLPTRIAAHWAAASGPAKQVLAKARAAEPALTKSIQEAAERLGGQMKGLEFRLKSPESLTRKIATDMADDGVSAAAAAADIADAVRYTATFPTDKLADAVKATLDRLQAEGCGTTKLLNTWLDDRASYKGINVQLRDATGQPFELQFHTPESYLAKEVGTHKIYEAMRRLDPGSAEWERLNEQQGKIFSSLTKPQGIEKIRPMRKAK